MNILRCDLGSVLLACFISIVRNQNAHATSDVAVKSHGDRSVLTLEESWAKTAKIAGSEIAKKPSRTCYIVITSTPETYQRFRGSSPPLAISTGFICNFT